MVNTMKKISLIICLIFFMIISSLSIYSSSFLLSSSYKYLYLKQIIWYFISFLIIYIIYKQKKEFFYKYSLYLYILGNLLLLLVLFFGTTTNGARCWFNIKGISIEPSEFMKVFLIITLSSILDNYKNLKRNFKNEILVIIKTFLLVLIPAFLTFLEPDTGMVLIYLLIYITMLFVYGIRYRWYILSILIISISIFSFIYFYTNYKDSFINLFGTNFFYRMDRIFDWQNQTGMQLSNALASIGTASLFGYGIGKIPIYYPEPHTDFIFTSLISTFGFVFTVFFILVLIYFDICLIRIALKEKYKNKYFISGVISIILFGQIQNIGMNIGLLPITGITLPFISYGGSSLITYMSLIGLILNLSKKDKKIKKVNYFYLIKYNLI